MSTSRHMDKICLTAAGVMLVLTILFMAGSASGNSGSGKTMKYESTLFDTSMVHRIDLVMEDWDSFIETCDDESYVSCTAVIDGKAYKNIAIRAKGNTSLSNVRSMDSQRYSFKLEFDHYEEGKTCDGLDKLCLNNLIQDNTMMKDYLSYTLMKDFGVDSPLCSFAYITVNGEDWGLYLAVEGIEESFLARHYDSDAGELYKPDSMSLGGGRGNGKAFDMEKAGLSEEISEDASMLPEEGMPFGGANRERPAFGEMQQGPGGEGNGPFGMGEMQEGMAPDGQMPAMRDGFGGGEGVRGSEDVKLQYIDEDPDSYPNIFENAKTDLCEADKMRLIAALKNLSAYADLEDTLDTEEVLRYFVVHNFLVNGDSYTGSMIHNYYLHEQDGKLRMIPWDYNLAFGTFMGGNASSSVNASIDEVLEDRPMQAWIFSDETYTQQYHALYKAFLEITFTDGAFEERIAETAALIRPYVEKDPTKFCTVEEFDAGVQALQWFCALRAEAVRRQLEGDLSVVDTGDLSITDMGSMGNGMGGRPVGREKGEGSMGRAFESAGQGTQAFAMDPGTRDEDREGRAALEPGSAPFGFEPNEEAGGARPGENALYTGSGPSFEEQEGFGEMQWVWIGISFAVLAAGLVIASKKKN